jgi:hypothetical protein
VKEDELDRAIDEAVKEIMGAEARPDLRRRVIERLSGPERQTWFTVPRLAAIAVAVLCLVVSGWIVRRSSTPPSTEIASAPQPPRPTEPAPPPSPAVRRAAPPVPARFDRRPALVRTARAARREDDRIVAATVLAEPESTVAISLLDPLRRIDPAPVKSEVVAMDAIAIAPLQEMEPVRIEPLSSSPR